MRWQGRQGSENVEDRRGRGGGRMMVGGAGGLLVVVLLAVLTRDPGRVLQFLVQNGPGVVADVGGRNEPSPEEEELKDFVSVVLRDTEDVWTRLFADMGKRYEKPKLVLFSGRIDSACGMASSAVGPFYCPGDRKVYLDLQFYQELRARFRAPGDFAQAYVVAHEIGHHVQEQLGISDRVNAMQRRVGKKEANELSVRLELQADYFAGVWAYHAEKSWRILEPGDVQEALRCASAIGDDALQRQSRGYVVPDSFTHGTSEQRMRWFQRGLETGDLSQGDTFAADEL